MSQLQVGDEVWLAHSENPETRVAMGTVVGIAGTGVFHCRPIPAKFVRVELKTVSSNVPLMIPVEEAEQENLNDAVGSSVLWSEDLTFLEK